MDHTLMLSEVLALLRYLIGPFGVRIISFSKKTQTGLLTNWPCPNSKERLPIRLTCRRGCFGSVLYGFPGRSPAFHLMSMPASLTNPRFSLFSLLDCAGSSQRRIVTYLPRRHQFLTTDFSRDIYALLTTVRDNGGNQSFFMPHSRIVLCREVKH